MNSIPKIPTPVNEPVLSYAPGTPERADLKRTLKELSGRQLEIPLVIGGKDVHTGTTVDVLAADDEGDLELAAGELFQRPLEVGPLRGPRGVGQYRLVDGRRNLGNAVHYKNLTRCTTLRRYVVRM